MENVKRKIFAVAVDVTYTKTLRSASTIEKSLYHDKIDLFNQKPFPQNFNFSEN